MLSTAKQDALISLLVLLASAALVYALVRRTGLRAVQLALIPLFFIDMLIFGGSQNSSSTDPKQYFGRTEQIVRFFKQEGASEYFRVNTRTTQGMIMDRNQGMVDRIFTSEGYTPLVLQRFFPQLGSVDDAFDLLNIKFKTVVNERTGALSIARHETYFPRAFFLYQTHVVHGDEELLSYLKSPEFDHRTIAVLEKDPSFTLASAPGTPQWTARITHYENNAIDLDAATDRDGVLVLSEIYYPGWKAYVDGKETEIYRTDSNLRGCFVPQGSHTIAVRFEPASYERGLAASLVTLALCGAGFGLSFMRSRRRAGAQPVEYPPVQS